jgi:capsule polysaccharide export protein KpsE/RkpR
MSSHYRDTLESLENGSWTTLMKVHIARDAKAGSKSAQNALELGDTLWKRLWQRHADRERARAAEQEVNGLRDTIQQLTDTLLAMENNNLKRK